jgi:hypothetical protein
MSDEKENLKIMPKLIIPNAYELYQFDSASLTQDEINARYFYNLRFLWLLESGDAILLPKLPAKGFLSYLVKLKKIDPDSLHVVILDDKHISLNSGVFTDANLITQLQKIIRDPSEWNIQTCYFNQEIALLAEKLRLPLALEWKMFIESDSVRQANSKAEFRDMSIKNNIPIPEGIVCRSEETFATSLKYFLKITGQVIIKQEYNASGKGNIGISFSQDQHFVGVIKTIILKKDQCINKVASNLWSTYNNLRNALFIVEVYYPNKGTFTAQFLVSSRELEPVLVNYSEILMGSRWVGVQIPPSTLSSTQIKDLIKHSKQFAYLMQMRGYQGYLCCDAILTHDNKIIFTEINVRPGAETHAYVLAQHLFGVGYEDRMVVLTRNGLKTDSFINTYQHLSDNNLLLNSDNNTGIILLTVDDTDSKQFEYLVAAPDLKSAHALERKIYITDFPD